MGFVCRFLMSVMIFSAVPVHQVLQLLHGFWFTISATGQYLPAIIYPDDTICCVYEKTTAQKERHWSKNRAKLGTLARTNMERGETQIQPDWSFSAEWSHTSVLDTQMYHKCTSCFLPAFACKFNWFDSSGVAGACCDSERSHKVLSVCV